MKDGVWSVASPEDECGCEKNEYGVEVGFGYGAEAERCEGCEGGCECECGGRVGGCGFEEEEEVAVAVAEEGAPAVGGGGGG